jgi:hypothetical protein
LRQCFAAGEAGIADENVRASARAFELRNGVLRSVRIRQVESEALGELEPVHRAFLEIGADHCRARAQECADERPANAAARARDHRALTLEAKGGKEVVCLRHPCDPPPSFSAKGFTEISDDQFQA